MKRQQPLVLPNGDALQTHFNRRQFLEAATLASAIAAVGITVNSQAGQSRPGTKTLELIYLTDLDRCQPPSALARKPRRNHWRLLDYETETLKGVMLVAGQSTTAPEISYAFTQKGWHAISFGVRSHGFMEDYARLQVRLKSDRAFCLITHEPDLSRRNRVDDYFWKCADLTGEQLVLRQYCTQVSPDHPTDLGNPCNSSWLAYIKLVPLTDQEVQALLVERRNSKTRRLFAHNDSNSFFAFYRPTSEADIRRELEPYRDTDFSRVYWEAGMGDSMYYPTKIGLRRTLDWVQDHHFLLNRLEAESWQVLLKKGIDPFHVALDYAHQIGLEFHGTYRPAGFHWPVPEDEWTSGGIYDQHPEWRGVDRRGRPTPRLSYAYPEVRQRVISLLKEMASYPLDGICLAYNRRPPLAEYEAPMVDGFKAKYGQDPRQIAERDPRWLSYRATFLTQFMREVRAAMKEIAQQQKRAKAPAVSAIVMSSEQENLYHAMDLRAWIKEGLVDTIIPYSSVERLDSRADSWVNPQDAQFFIQITRGTTCELALNMMPRQLSPEEYRRRAYRLYQAGVENLFFWDTNLRSRVEWRNNYFTPAWSVMRRLGHREEIEAWVHAGSPPIEQPGSNLVKLGDWELGYGTPG